MRIWALLFLLVNLHLVAYNQVIKGIVFDKKNDSAISFAAIYFNGTFVGTQSNINGNFELDISKNTSRSLTISALGYYSVTLTTFSADLPLLVYLTPKVYDMHEITVSGNSLVRKRKANLKLFRNEFLGTTFNARNCDIINENDITFNYNSDEDTLKAFASTPILINNNALGYNITYYLDKFEYYKKSCSFFYRGNIIFSKDLKFGDGHKQLYERRRRNTYLGSRMHFFRALWANELESSGFIVKNSDEKSLNYNDIVITENIRLDSPKSHNKALKYGENLFIHYTKLSTLIFLKSKVFFDKDGYFDQSGIKWQGDMVTQRVGDQLPYEY